MTALGKHKAVRGHHWSSHCTTTIGGQYKKISGGFFGAFGLCAMGGDRTSHPIDERLPARPAITIAPRAIEGNGNEAIEYDVRRVGRSEFELSELGE